MSENEHLQRAEELLERLRAKIDGLEQLAAGESDVDAAVDDLAEIAEEAQHHPDITIKHTKVTLRLTTHDAGGVTELDVELAQRVDNLVD